MNSAMSGRSSRVWDVVDNGPWWVTVDLVEGEGMAGIAHALRGCLEGMRIGVHLWSVANANNAERLLAGRDGAAPYLILAVHADGQRLRFLSSSVGRPEGTTYTAVELRSMLDVGGRTVIALGCSAGSPELRDAFLAAGARAFVAPSGAPFGHAALVFATLLFFNLTQGDALEAAVVNARAAHPEFEMWSLASRTPVVEEKGEPDATVEPV